MTKGEAPPGHDEMPRNEGGQWEAKGKEKLGKAFGLRLPLSYDEQVRALPPGEQTAWMRDIIMAAIDRGDLPDITNETDLPT